MLALKHKFTMNSKPTNAGRFIRYVLGESCTINGVAVCDITFGKIPSSKNVCYFLSLNGGCIPSKFSIYILKPGEEYFVLPQARIITNKFPCCCLKKCLSECSKIRQEWDNLLFLHSCPTHCRYLASQVLPTVCQFGPVLLSILVKTEISLKIPRMYPEVIPPSLRISGLRDSDMKQNK